MRLTPEQITGLQVGQTLTLVRPLGQHPTRERRAQHVKVQRISEDGVTLEDFPNVLFHPDTLEEVRNDVRSRTYLVGADQRSVILDADEARGRLDCFGVVLKSIVSDEQAIAIYNKLRDFHGEDELSGMR